MQQTLQEDCSWELDGLAENLNFEDPDILLQSPNLLGGRNYLGDTVS